MVCWLYDDLDSAMSYVNPKPFPVSDCDECGRRYPEHGGQCSHFVPFPAPARSSHVEVTVPRNGRSDDVYLVQRAVPVVETVEVPKHEWDAFVEAIDYWSGPGNGSTRWLSTAGERLVTAFRAAERKRSIRECNV